jgi:hypothetical protein
LNLNDDAQLIATGFYSFERKDGTKVSESGSQNQVGPQPEDIGIVSRGSYSFTTPDGVVLTVNWVADENGFQATGDHLPTPPPMPEHRLLRLLTSSANNAGLLAAPKGSYSFTTPDGVVITVNWVADENGFQATGDHLPTPPPMPEHVVKMLADLKAARLL